MAATIVANATTTLYNGIPRSSTSGHLLLPPRCAPTSECDPSVLWHSSSSYQLRRWSLSSPRWSWSRRWPGWSTGGLGAMARGGDSLPSFYSSWTDSISMCPAPSALGTSLLLLTLFRVFFSLVNLPLTTIVLWSLTHLACSEGPCY
jgi:hypothetical protein